MKKIFKYGLGLGVVAGIEAPIIILATNANSGSSVLFQGRRTIVEYKKSSVYAGRKNRIWDLSVQANAMTSKPEYDIQTTTLFRQRVTKTSSVTYGPGNLTQTPPVITKKEEEFKFDGISSVEIDNGTTYHHAKTLINALGATTTKTFTFTVPKGIKYVNSKGIETKYDYKAIDFFYGMMRGVYSSSEVIEKGEIGSIPTLKPISHTYFDKLLDSDMYDKESKKMKSGFDNLNLYLYNLYGVDLNATIKANVQNLKDGKDKFVIKFKDPQNTGIIYNLMSDVNMITPISSQKINQLNGNYQVDFSLGSPGDAGKFLQLAEFGVLKSKNGKVDLSDELKVARYYVANYDINPNTDGVVLKKNEHSFDLAYNKAKDNIEKYQILIVDDSIDPDVFAQIRQKSFLEDNSESILFGDVLGKPTLMETIREKGLIDFKEGSKGEMIKEGYWNPWYLIGSVEKENRLDDNTAKLLFGQVAKDAQINSDALAEYFLGRGRQFRTLLNDSINLYGITKQWKANSPLFKTVKNFTDGQVVVPGTSLKDIYDDPSGFPDGKRASVEHGAVLDKEQMDYFSDEVSKHSKDKEFLKPSAAKYIALKKAWKKFLDDARTKLGLSSTAKFTIPLYDYRYINDAADWNKDKIAAYKLIIKQLNRLTNGLDIDFTQFHSTASKSTNSVSNRAEAPFLYIGAGPDYSSVMSVIQQLLSASYGTYPLIPMVIEALDPSNTNNEIKTYDPSDQNSWDLNGKVSIKDYIDFMKNNNSKGDYNKALDIKVLKSINFKDWIAFTAHKLGRFDSPAKNRSKLKAMQQLDNAFQKFGFSISGNKTAVLKYLKIFADLSMPYKLALGNAVYTALGPKAGELSVHTSYASKWLLLAETASNSIDTINIFDTKVKLKD